MGLSVGDLGEKYFTECLGLPASVLAGCGLVSNMLYQPKRADLDRYFDEVPTNAMVQGDVCIWEYGHIAIFDHYDGSCWYFSQNPNPCQVMKIGGNGLHAFRLKGSKPAPAPQERYLNLQPTVNSWTVYKTSNYYIPSKESDVAGHLNPQKYNGLSYRILQDMGNYHFKIHTSYYGDVYIAGNPNKYACNISNTPQFPTGSY